MYKIIGSDGKEYGPVSLEQIRAWAAQGRLSAKTRVQGPGGTEWKPAGDWAELAGSFTAAVPPAAAGQASASAPAQAMAVASLVLGILSFACAGLCLGIPAIVLGHLAHSRARRQPARYGGSGLAAAGFVLGYASIFTTVVMLGLLLPALAKAKEKAVRINCVNNLKQIGLAEISWAADHDHGFPFNVSTNKGGTLELCSADSEGFERNSARHFQVLSNELGSTLILVCPADHSKQAASGFANLTAANVTYRVHSGTNLSEADPSAVLVVCPIHGNVLLGDGSVAQGSKRR